MSTSEHKSVDVPRGNVSCVASDGLSGFERVNYRRTLRFRTAPQHFTPGASSGG